MTLSDKRKQYIAFRFAIAICLLSAFIYLSCSSGNRPTTDVNKLGLILEQKGNLPKIEASLMVTPDIHSNVIISGLAGTLHKLRDSCKSTFSERDGDIPPFNINFIVDKEVVLIGERNEKASLLKNCFITHLKNQRINGFDTSKYIVDIDLKISRRPI